MPKRDWMVEFRDSLLHGILQFWIDHGIDREYGGALGWLDRAGRAVSPGTKSVAQQGRLLWTFAEVFRRVSRAHLRGSCHAPSEVPAGQDVGLEAWRLLLVG